MPPAIQAQNLSRTIPVNDSDRHLLEHLSFAISPGETVHLIGPSGSGKTTLLRLINRLDEPSAGELVIEGRPLGEWPVQELRRHVGMVFQESTLLGLSVEENLALPFRLAGEENTIDQKRMTEALERVELGADFLTRREGELSVGQKQRVALARALIRPPQILLLDEPTSGLDAPLASRMLETLGRIQRETRLTMLITTHRLEELRQTGGRVFLLDAGRLVDDCPAESLLGENCSPAARRFLESASLGRPASGQPGEGREEAPNE